MTTLIIFMFVFLIIIVVGILNEKFISWLAKNRYNRILTWADIYEGYKENGMLQEAEN